MSCYIFNNTHIIIMFITFIIASFLQLVTKCNKTKLGINRVGHFFYYLGNQTECSCDYNRNSYSLVNFLQSV